MKAAIKITILILGFSLLAACSSRGGEESPTPQPESVLTAAAQTADAQLTELAEPDSTATETPSPENTIPAVTITAAGPGESSDPLITSTITPTAATGGVDLAEFWADVTVPDGTQFDPGEQFTKIWQLRNAGTNTWTPEYSFAFFSGAQMSGPARVSLTGNVSPGGTVDIPVDMVAPQAGGTHVGYWKMQDPASEFFDYAVFVEINVVGETAASTSPPQPSGSGRVTAASIQVDSSSASECPHTFTFTGTFTLDGPATVSYRLEASSETSGFTFNLPGDLTGSFDAGSHSVVYYLDIQDDVTGSAQFHILAPNDRISQPVNFSLSCGS
jgi:hypothetical protein